MKRDIILLLATLCSVSVAFAAETFHYEIMRAAACATYSSEVHPRNALALHPNGVLNAGPNYAYGYCQLDLPDGACIKQAAAYGSDTSMWIMVFRLYEASWCSEAPELITEWESENNEELTCTTSKWPSDANLNVVVDRDNKTYFIHFFIHSETTGNESRLRLWNLEVYYSLGGTCS